MEQSERNGHTVEDEGRKPPILVCVPWVKFTKRHLPHFMEWYAANKERHRLWLCWCAYQPLHQVQAQAVAMAIKIKASHILFTEDDHWGYPVDGLDVLLEADKDIIGFPTHRKSAPYLPLIMNKKDKSVNLIGRHANLTPAFQGSGPEIQQVDLLTWAFTLVKTDVFRRMIEADKYPFSQYGPVPTDSFFCQYAEDLGIPVHTHFGATIPHGDVKPEHIPFLRRAYDAIDSHEKRFQRVAAEDALSMQRELVDEDYPAVEDQNVDFANYSLSLVEEFG